MKKTVLLLTALILISFVSKSQNDIMYVYKNGSIIYQHAIVDIDSIIFYNTDTSICGTDSIQDYDGNWYKTVQIGNQCWMKENMATTHYADGTALVDGTGAGDISGDYITKYMFDHNDNPTNTATYGKLYIWAAAMNGAASSNSNPSEVQGVCPTGWHLPSNNEWTELTDYLGGESVAGGKMKETGTTHWNSPNTGATNSSGFTALPGGGRWYDGSFSGVGGNSYFWSATESSSVHAMVRKLSNNTSVVENLSFYKTVGYSVRCVKD